MNIRSVALAGVAIVVLAIYVAAALLEWDGLLWVATATLLLASLALQISSRAVISDRLFAVGRKLERLVTRNQQVLAKRTPNATVTKTSSSAIEPVSPTASRTAVAPPAPAARSVSSATSLKSAAEPQDPVTRIAQSGIFDVELYSMQVSFHFDEAEAAIRHYLRRGRRSGFLPHPLFLPSLVDSNWSKSDVDPLVAYLSDPKAARETVTHPLFDPSELDLEALPDGETPLEWFLRTSDPAFSLPSSPGALRTDRTVADVREEVIQSFSELRRVHLNFDPLRGSSEPPAYDAALQAKVREFTRSRSRPLVSIVLPTWNRGASIRTAIESVIEQTYAEWELLIADDGSTDDTCLVVDSIAARDARVRLLRLPHRGVSAARNAALAASAGEFIAFLDSDKRWDRRFLRTMLAVLQIDNVDAAVAACEVTYGDKVVYRAIQPTVGSLAIANSVDQTAIVARRSLILETGGFDESLRRAVDYDLVLKIAEHTTLHQVPYVGLRYSEDDTDPNRISEFETKAWNHHVSDRHAWSAFRAAREHRSLDEDLVTVIVDDVRSLLDAKAQIDWLHEHRGRFELEVILVPHSGGWALRAALGSLTHATLDVRVLTTGFRADRPRYLNAAIRMARGATCVILEARQRVLAGDVETLCSRLDRASAAHPVVLGPTRLVDNAGVIYPEYGSDPIAFLRGMPADILHGIDDLPVPAAPFPLAARTRDLCDVEGATALLDSLMADVELSQKLARHTKRDVVVAPDVLVQQGGAIWTARSDKAPDDVRTLRQLWPSPPEGSRQAMDAVGVDAAFNGFTALSFPTEHRKWSNAVLTPQVSRVAHREAPLRFAIRTAAPSDERAVNWGDYHYAQSLADAFRRAGQTASVDYQPNADRGTSGFDDVVINLRGLRDVPVPSNATSILWILSHPEMVTAKEVEKYDLAYAASVSWAKRQTEQWGLPIRALLQCTDPGRFHPGAGERPDLAHSIVMVGNSRRQFRPAAWHAANAGYPVKIWGTLWEGMVPDECIMGQSLPNEALAPFYRSARWTLNDHWSDMRDDGFISNRIFDVLASGGKLITDDVAGLDQVFGDKLAVFHSPAELLQLLESPPAAVYPPGVLESLSAEVRDFHSFDARALRLLEDVRTHRARRHANW